jgi:hypothetical protein
VAAVDLGGWVERFIYRDKKVVNCLCAFSCPSMMISISKDGERSYTKEIRFLESF